MRSYALFLFIQFISSISSVGDNQNILSDINTIKEKLYLINFPVSHDISFNSYHPVDSIDLHFSLEEGKWDDINYNDTTYSFWEAAEHWQRLYELAVNLNMNLDKHEFATKRKQQIIAGINYWLNNTPDCDNFWWFDIGIPLYMGKVLVLMKDHDLPVNIFNEVIKRMNLGIKDDHYEFEGVATGQNLLWLVSIHIYSSCLTNNYEGLERAFNELANEISYHYGEGIQYDYSFHQHGEQFYSLGYGRSYAILVAQITYLANDTQFELQEEKIEILSNLFLKGIRWMIFKGQQDYSAMGREIARPLNKFNALVRSLNYMIKIDNKNVKTYQEFIKEISNKTNKTEGNRHFWHSDFMVHRRNDYYFSVKMASNRIIWSESGNNENIKGYYLGNGVTLISRTGKEYQRIFPMWNWQKLPGLLAEQTNEQLPLIDWGQGARNSTKFVGGVTDGITGCAAYNYEKKSLSAKRAWFFSDIGMVCLIGGLDYNGGNTLCQSINQCLASNKITYIADEGKYRVENDDILRKGIYWINHDSVTYITEPSNQVYITKFPKEANWKCINQSINKMESAHIFNLGIDLGKKYRTNDSLFYAVIPGMSELEAEKYRFHEHVYILANNKKCQAVYFPEQRLYQIVFYEPYKLWLNNSISILSRNPRIIQIKGTTHHNEFEISIANPFNDGLKSLLEINAELVGDYCCWIKEQNKTLINIPDFEIPYSGKTKKINLKISNISIPFL